MIRRRMLMGKAEEDVGNNGYEYVDLGLPSGNLWATCNLGADTPQDYGTYYTGTDPIMDVMGGEWEVPYYYDWLELSIYTIRTYQSNGVLLTSVANGNTLFLPFGGFYYSYTQNYENRGSEAWYKMNNNVGSYNSCGWGPLLNNGVVNIVNNSAAEQAPLRGIIRRDTSTVNDYLTLTALETGVIQCTIPKQVPTSTLSYIEYSVNNGATWGRVNNSDSSGMSFAQRINAGSTILVRGSGKALAYYTSHYTYISSEVPFLASGNIMSLLNPTSFSTITDISGSSYRSYTFFKLFYGCSKLLTAPLLPATTLSAHTYRAMFGDCSALRKTPELPATVLSSEGVYNSMFIRCTGLRKAMKILPCMSVPNSAYAYMFNGCSKLKTAPILPCVSPAMFMSYTQMFYNCSQLNYVKAMFTSIPSNTYPDGWTFQWLYGVASTGTFIKNSAATWTTTGPSGIPNGWTVQTANS